MTGTPFLLPATISPSPTKVTGTAGNGQVAVWWTAPASNGGSAITSYQVQLATSVGGPYSNAAGCPTNSTTTSCTSALMKNDRSVLARSVHLPLI